MARELELDSMGETGTESERLGEGANWALATAAVKTAIAEKVVTCRITDTRRKDDMLFTSCFGLFVVHVAKHNLRVVLRRPC